MDSSKREICCTRVGSCRDLRMTRMILRRRRGIRDRGRPRWRRDDALGPVPLEVGDWLEAADAAAREPAIEALPGRDADFRARGVTHQRVESWNYTLRRRDGALWCAGLAAVLRWRVDFHPTRTRRLATVLSSNAPGWPNQRYVCSYPLIITLDDHKTVTLARAPVPSASWLRNSLWHEIRQASKGSSDLTTRGATSAGPPPHVP